MKLEKIELQRDDELVKGQYETTDSKVRLILTFDVNDDPQELTRRLYVLHRLQFGPDGEDVNSEEVEELVAFFNKIMIRANRKIMGEN